MKFRRAGGIRHSSRCHGCALVQQGGLNRSRGALNGGEGVLSAIAIRRFTVAVQRHGVAGHHLCQRGRRDVLCCACRDRLDSGETNFASVNESDRPAVDDAVDTAFTQRFEVAGAGDDSIHRCERYQNRERRNGSRGPPTRHDRRFHSPLCIPQRCMEEIAPIRRIIPLSGNLHNTKSRGLASVCRQQLAASSALRHDRRDIRSRATMRQREGS